MKKTYQGSCHCKTLTFEADLDLTQGTGKCNCSICHKTRAWSAMVKPDDFRLLTGGKEVRDYQFGSNAMHHHFCPDCGVRPFAKGYLDVLGGDFYTVNIACIDTISIEELAELPVNFSDGKNDNWMEQPKITCYL